ncbi:hypothetical protein EYF80_006021 [Liparis tanakae]|uniref:Uncharacterized protein n=1 Tax=Liparis tanakae TaxID=230148 RepID=A0A4Z2J0I9_9TELE|nr:hypothetical protein EYF80_006021 [Liparis tanakae]
MVKETWQDEGRARFVHKHLAPNTPRPISDSDNRIPPVPPGPSFSKSNQDFTSFSQGNTLIFILILHVNTPAVCRPELFSSNKMDSA